MTEVKLKCKVKNNNVPTCTDLDEDCDDLDHLHCWLYDPSKGMCPFLRGKR